MLLDANTGSKPKEVAPKGLYGIRVYAVVDFGTQAGEYQGKPTRRRKIGISYELDCPMSDGRPFALHREYTANIVKGNLADDVEILLDRKPDLPFDLRDLLGVEASASVVIKEYERDGQKLKKNEIQALLPASATGKHGPKEKANPQLYFSLDEFDQGVYDKLPKYVQEKIAKSPEYAKATGKQTTVEDDITF